MGYTPLTQMNSLTLVVLCHDRMLRMEINACNFRNVELVFHQRKERFGSVMTRMPFLETHIAIIRGDAGLEILDQVEQQN